MSDEMNKRKFKRNNQVKASLVEKVWLKDSFITNKAKVTVIKAKEGEPEISTAGNFIFLSTISGEGWMLDHRENLALRLADHYEELPYKIIESKENFGVEWNERFSIEDGKFTAFRNGQPSSVFFDYPPEELLETIEALKNDAN